MFPDPGQGIRGDNSGLRLQPKATPAAVTVGQNYDIKLNCLDTPRRIHGVPVQNNTPGYGAITGHIRQLYLFELDFGRIYCKFHVMTLIER